MAFQIPQGRSSRPIQIPKRQVPVEQIIATEGYNPVASGIDVAGQAIGSALLRRAELRRQGQQLAKMEQLAGVPQGSYSGLDPEVAQQLLLVVMKSKEEEKQFQREAELKRELQKTSPGGYFIPRGVDPQTNQPVYSSSKMPGLFYADMTPYQGGAPGELTLQTLPSEQIEKETALSTLKLAGERIRFSYNPKFVGPVASKFGKGKQYIEGLATPEAADFYGNVADARNQIIYLRSGKQINEEEYRRLLATLPNENLSPTDFKTKLDNFDRLIGEITSSRKRILPSTGYRVPLGKDIPSKVGKNRIGRFEVEVLP